MAFILVGLVAGAGIGGWIVARRFGLGRPADSRRWFDHLPAAALVLDLSRLRREFDRLREQGVSDCVAHLCDNPSELPRLAALARVRYASADMLADLRVKDLAALRRRPERLSQPPFGQAMRYIIESVWAGRELVEDEYSIRGDDGGERTWVMRTRVPDAGRDWSSVLVAFMELTASNRAAATQLENEELVQQLLGQANILVWWAKVRLENDLLHWKVHVPQPAKGCDLYRLATSLERGGLWDREHALDNDEMDARARRAILEGRRHYQQEFRIRGHDRIHWLAEDVAIQRLGQGEWSLMGVVTDVTARHESEDARLRSEALVRQILERADCMLWQARVRQMPDGRFDWVCDVPMSRLMRRLFGRTEAIKEGHIYDESDSYPDKADMDRLSNQALREGWPGYEQTIRVVRDGQTHWLHEQVSIRTIAPGLWDLIGVGLDVTARQQAEDERRASDARLRQILGQIECLVWQARVTARPDGGLAWSLFVPPSSLYREIFERDPLNNGDSELWSVVQVPELAEMNARARDAMRMSLSGYEQEFRVFGSTKTFWLHELVSIKRIGPSEWNVAGVVTDITDRRETEMALAEEKERLSVTLEAMEEAVVNADREGRILFVNRSAARLLGRSAEQLVGQRFDAVFQWQPARGEGPVGVRFGDVSTCEKSVELPPNTALKTASHVALPVEGCFAPVRSPDGRTSGVVLVVRDVSERQRLEVEMLRASKLESVGVLAGGIAHDFNNILTAILANLSIALADSGLDNEAVHSVRDAERAAMRARDLTQQLLTFAKGGNPVRTAVLLPDVLREVAGFALRGSGVKCEFDLEPSLWPIEADRGQIGQVVQNLVINAAQAMRSGTVRIRAGNQVVESDPSRALTPGPHVWIEVIDSGPGIPPEHLSRIFDPYFTTKSDGSGLGLATVYAVVRRHGGAVEANSEPGKGARFRVRLPAKPGATAAPGPAEPVVPRARMVGRVLVMDDEEAIRLVAQKMLSRLGLEVVVSRDGAEAVECVRKALDERRPFDCVVLDLTVPGGMGGEEALRAMRVIAPGVRAIISSGYSHSNALARPADIGAQGVVAKPYSMDEFARVLERVLHDGGPGDRGEASVN